jgi:hypothetical protein
VFKGTRGGATLRPSDVHPEDVHVTCVSVTKAAGSRAGRVCPFVRDVTQHGAIDFQMFWIHLKNSVLLFSYCSFPHSLFLLPSAWMNCRYASVCTPPDRFLSRGQSRRYTCEVNVILPRNDQQPYTRCICTLFIDIRVSTLT